MYSEVAKPEIVSRKLKLVHEYTNSFVGATPKQVANNTSHDALNGSQLLSIA